jgi:DNA invertase Pin-like site-specific DNA recombinase
MTPREIRRPRGEQHHKAKLTWEDVRTIRKRYAEGGVTMQRLADDYLISRSTVRPLLAGTTWADPGYVPSPLPGPNKGERAYTAVLTWELVKEIRQQYAGGERSMQCLATEYGVGSTTIYRVVRNLRWYDPEYTPPASR